MKFVLWTPLINGSKRMALLFAIATVMITVAMTPDVAWASSIIFDNGPPGNVAGFTFENNGVADDFTLANPATLTDVRFWAYISPVCASGFSCPATPPFFDTFAATLQQVGWGIFSDNGGLPGTLIYSGLSNAAVTDLGYRITQNPDDEAFQVDFGLGAVNLTEGIYWLALSQGPLGTFNGLQGNGIGESGWLWSTTGSGANAVYGYGDWQRGTYQSQNAFELFSEAPAPVPEPSSLLLMGTGLVGAGVSRWRKRRFIDPARIVPDES